MALKDMGLHLSTTKKVGWEVTAGKTKALPKKKSLAQIQDLQILEEHHHVEAGAQRSARDLLQRGGGWEVHQQHKDDEHPGNFERWAIV